MNEWKDEYHHVQVQGHGSFLEKKKGILPTEDGGDLATSGGV